MKFEFATASKIIFGYDSSRQVPEMASHFGNRALVLFGPQKTGSDLINANQNWDYLQYEVVSGEPSLPILEGIVQSARRNGIDVVISIGGGSVIDMGKATSGLIPNRGDIRDYLEVVGKNEALKERPVPFIAIPTTAGTGAEVTRNAVISVPEKNVKVSLRSPFLYPAVAVIDPKLTYSMPGEVTANTGLDALTQVLEPYVSVKANMMTDLFCQEGLTRIGRSLVNAYRDGNDETAREDMCWGSLLGGLALANAGLGAVHGFAGPIGGMFNAPHGAICAALLPYVTRMNIKVLQKKDPTHPVLKRYHQAGNYLLGKEILEVSELVEGLFVMISELKIRPLGDWGITHGDIQNVVEKAQQASSMKGNPITLEAHDLEQILIDAM
jgi:alcohol dehydrogenase class IV